MNPYFEDRMQAGKDLAIALAEFLHVPDVLVLALPRGGLPVAEQVARFLLAELDVLIVRKVAKPFYPEVALAAIAIGGACALNPEAIAAAGVGKEELDALIKYERTELVRREHVYRGERSPPRIAGRTVIVVDDGMATGATMQCAVTALRALAPAKLVVAVPVAPQEVALAFYGIADKFVCLSTPRDFRAVGWWYHDFPQLTDQQVIDILGRNQR